MKLEINYLKVMLKDNWEEKHGTHVGNMNMMLQSLEGFSDNQPSSIIEAVSFKHHQNHNVSETRPVVDNGFSQSEAHKSLPPMEASRTNAEKSIVGSTSNMQDLIKFLSTNYGPLKTPLEMGTPEYLRLVDILQQSDSYSKVGELNNNNNATSVVRMSEENEILSINNDDEEKLVGYDKKNDSKKLWEGSLQLSSSVTLSAAAFFRSGEKLVCDKWPESIQVKGKVRLEAFEKYVKDLPRSCNRGLMVISVCWKEGSSNTGLTGMKEVAKGYKKSSRVGFAQVLSGIDLYICPRSDPIITILAKYGFFKGMSVLDDKQQDSMIGCVVWRKNRPLNPVNTKNAPDSNHPIQPPNSPPSLPEEPPLTSNTETATDVDRNSTPDTCNLVIQKRAFQDDVDDLPEFDFGSRLAAAAVVVNCQKMDNSVEQLSKKTKLFDDNDDDMPEWCPPMPPSNFHNLPLCPPRPPPLPILPPPPPRPDTRPSFSYQPFRPSITSPPPTFMAAPLPPPPPLPLPPPPPPPVRFNSNQGMWHRPGLSNGNPLFNRRPPQQ